MHWQGKKEEEKADYEAVERVAHIQEVKKSKSCWWLLLLFSRLLIFLFLHLAEDSVDTAIGFDSKEDWVDDERDERV